MPRSPRASDRLSVLLVPSRAGQTVCFHTTKTRLLVWVLVSVICIGTVTVHGVRAVVRYVASLDTEQAVERPPTVRAGRIESARVAAYQLEMRQMQREMDRVERENDTLREATDLLASGFAQAVDRHQEQMAQFTRLTSIPLPDAEADGEPASPEDGDGRGGPLGPLSELNVSTPGLRAAESELHEMLALTGRLQRLNIRLQAQQHLLRSTPMLCPLEGRWHLTDAFGRRRHPVTGAADFHNGIDLSAPSGTDILAPADGVVTFVGRQSGYGRLVIIDHGTGLLLSGRDGPESVPFQTYYGHLRRSLVQVGDQVERGQAIAEVGSSGLSTGPHLHYEIRVAGEPVNPLDFIADR